MHAVIETDAYLDAADDVGLAADEREAIIETLARNPKLGDLMVGTGGARKLRVAGRGKGKSGGYRVVSYFGGEDIPVFLLTVFSKGDRANLSAADKAAVKAELEGLADDYRKGRRP